MSDRFDITRVRLRGYRSIAACDVPLGDLTMLVGPNGSGKSNFLDALRFTAQALTDGLPAAVRERGGFGELKLRSSPASSDVEIGFEFKTETTTGEYELAFRRDAKDLTVTTEYCGVREKGMTHPAFFRFDANEGRSSERFMPRLTPGRLMLVAFAGADAFTPVYNGLANLMVYNINPDVVRRPQPPDLSSVLLRDGSNLASVLLAIRDEQPSTLKRVEEYLSRVVPGVNRVRPRDVGGYLTLQFRQDHQNGRGDPWYPARSMSDGTLRVVGLLVAMFGDQQELASPVGIEEPELALHPAAAGVLLDALRDAASARQVLVTTHSPDLLDSPDITADQLLAVRAHSGITQIGPIDAGGQLALRESLYTPGELLRVDQLTPANAPEPASSSDGGTVEE